MDANEIMRQIEEIEDSLQWCSPEAKAWHAERLEQAKAMLNSCSVATQQKSCITTKKSIATNDSEA